MEKIIYVKSKTNMKNDGLDEAAKLLNEGWSVKHISACATEWHGDTYAYIVLEKKN